MFYHSVFSIHVGDYQAAINYITDCRSLLVRPSFPTSMLFSIYACFPRLLILLACLGAFFLAATPRGSGVDEPPKPYVALGLV